MINEKIDEPIMEAVSCDVYDNFFQSLHNRTEREEGMMREQLNEFMFRDGVILKNEMNRTRRRRREIF